MSEPSSTAAACKPRRRWLQFSLRTMLVLMVPVACAAAWVGAEYRRGQRQWAAIAWVEQMGGAIEYDDEATQNNWRRQWFGEWFPQSVVAVRLNPPAQTAGGLVLYPNRLDIVAPLAELTHLKSLDLSYTGVSDLSSLAELNELESLSVVHTRVSDLTPLAEMKNLEVLSLRSAKVSDLTPLVDLSSLRWIDVNGTRTSDEQVRALQQALPNCHIELYYELPPAH